MINTFKHIILYYIIKMIFELIFFFGGLYLVAWFFIKMCEQEIEIEDE